MPMCVTVALLHELTVYLLVSKQRCILSDKTAQLVHLQTIRLVDICHSYHISHPESLT
jgi:hypothetical protein